MNINVSRMVETYLRFASTARDSYSKEELSDLYEEVSLSLGGADSDSETHEFANDSDSAARECAKMMCFICLGQAVFGQAMREALGEKGTALDTVRAVVALCERPPEF